MECIKNTKSCSLMGKIEKLLNLVNPVRETLLELKKQREPYLSLNLQNMFDIAGCCWRVKVAFTKDHINGVYRLHPYIFGYYTMEPGLVNGRNHYASEPDGRFVISFCGDSWWIQSNDVRGQCRGWAHSGWKIDQCVYDIEYSWRYYIPSVESFIDADKGLSVWCKS